MYVSRTTAFHLVRAAAPSRAGREVDAAVLATRRGSVDTLRAFSEGKLEAVWINDTGPGNESLQAIIKLVKQARQEVCIQSYAWRYDDPDVVQLFDALAARQREVPGLRVAIAYDRDKLGQESMQAVLARHGVRAQTAAYSSLLSRGSNHAKVFLVDGKVGVTGGANCESKPEKDLMVKLSGPVLASLYADFDFAWRHSHAWFDAGGKPLAAAPEPAHPAVVAGEPPAGGWTPMTLLTKRGNHLEGNTPRLNDANAGLLAAMGAARRVLKLESPNCNDVGVWEAIAAAAGRGVRVQVLLAKDYNPVGTQIDRGSNKQFLRFMAKLPPASRERVELRWYSPDGKQDRPNHTKYVSVDGQWCYVGSQNLDNQSWGFSRELGLGIDDGATTRRLDREVFDQDWATSLAVKPTWLDHLVDLPARSWLTRPFSWLNPRVLLGELF